MWRIGLAVDDDVLHAAVGDGQGATGGGVLLRAGNVGEREIAQAVLVRPLDVEELLALHADVAECDVVASRQGHVVAIALGVELRPGAHEQEVAASARQALDAHPLVVLGCVGAHLQPEDVACVVGHAVAHDDVPVVQALRTHRDAAVHRPIVAALHEYVVARSVLGCLVGEGALAALQDHGIVVDVHVAAAHHHVVTGIDVDGVGRGALDVGGGGIDVEVEESDVVALVYVIGPKRRVYQPDILQGYVAGVRDKGEARTLLVLVGAFRVPRATNPEGLPEGFAAAVDGARAGDGESVDVVGIDQCGKVLARLSLDARLHDGIVGNRLRALQHGTLLEMQMRARTEEERPRQEGALGYDDYAAALMGSLVDDGLQGLGLHIGALAAHAMSGDDVSASQQLGIDLGRIGKPLVHRFAVGPDIGLLLGVGSRCNESRQQREA